MSDATDRAAALAEVIEKAEVFDFPSICSPGEMQLIATTIRGAVTQAGDIEVKVTAASMSNSPKTILVPVEDGDTAYIIAAKVRMELALDLDIGGFFDVGGAGITIYLAAKQAAANDATMNLSIMSGTAEGLVDAPVSITTREGEERDISKVEKIVDNNRLAQRWTPGGMIVQTGMKILPATPNGRVYTVTQGGTMGAAEPFRTDYFSEKIFDNGVVLEDAGPSLDNIYNINAAISEAWEAKAGKAANLLTTKDVNMSKIFDNCMRMSESFLTPLIG